MVKARSANGEFILIHKKSAKFGDFGQNYRPPAFANGVKLPDGA